MTIKLFNFQLKVIEGIFKKNNFEKKGVFCVNVSYYLGNLFFNKLHSFGDQLYKRNCFTFDKSKHFRNQPGLKIFLAKYNCKMYPVHK